MLFTDIRLQNFRSYKEASFELGPGVNIVVGPNTAGKTNLLEALMLNAVGKSYKASDQLLVRSSEEWARVDAHTNTNQLRSVKILKRPDGKAEKSFVIDAKDYKKLSINNKYPVVLFQPGDLNLLNFEPANRREYLDNFIEQFVVGHASSVARMKRILAQRNALLKQPNVSSSHLFTWDLRLSEVSGEVIKSRIETLEKINTGLKKVYSTIAGIKTNATFRYESKINPDNYSTNLIKVLEKNLELDKIRGFTSSGPHRDDILAYFDDEPLVNSASRGENRTFMLSLKILELQILESETGKRPLLLLDDVFSELDGARRRALTNYLNGYQTLITTTDADAIMQDFADNSNKITI
jgi:DNA replication and repair protein RecF